MNDLTSFLRDMGIHGQERLTLERVFAHHERRWFAGHLTMIVLALVGLMLSAFLATPAMAHVPFWATPAVMGFIAAFALKAYLMWRRDSLPQPLQQFCWEREAALSRIAGHYPPY
jgi:hypothetical protein